MGPSRVGTTGLLRVIPPARPCGRTGVSSETGGRYSPLTEGVCDPALVKDSGQCLVPKESAFVLLPVGLGLGFL